MKIIIDIPEEFEKHFDNDRFEDSLKRLKSDAGTFCMAGKYEIELCEMLIEAFKTSTKVKYTLVGVDLAGVDLAGVKRGTKRVIEWND